MFDRVKSEAAKLKDQLQTEVNPLKKIDECIAILKAEHKQGEEKLTVAGAGAAATGAASVASGTSKSSFAKAFGVFTGLVAFGLGVYAAGTAVEREIRPLSSLHRDKLRKILAVSDELRLGLTEKSMLREAMVIFDNARNEAIKYERRNGIF